MNAVTKVLKLPGVVSRTSWQLPEGLTFEQWAECGRSLVEVEGSVQWWIGDWWAYGQHAYGERKDATKEGGLLEDLNFKTAANYGSVARAFETSRRREVLSFTHHAEVIGLSSAIQDSWLARAEREGLSVNKLRAAIARDAAFDRTSAVEFEAAKLGKFAVLYADPPWRYENPPMGGSNRSIENHYPTMELEDICALPIGDIAHENAVLFLWATSPKLAECMQVITAWGFIYRTDMIWMKDKIGMGYHAREKHETLLIAKRGELPPPPVEARPDSVLSFPRLEHSAKPQEYYNVIDRMYPDVRKIELFGRAPEDRPLWSTWGNQAVKVIAA